jgi:hypothetical protein
MISLLSMLWGCIGVPGHAGVQGNEIADKLTRDGSVPKFVGPELALGVSRQKIRKKIGCLLVTQQWARWQGLGNTQRQAQKLISGPCLGARTRFLSFNRTQSRDIIGLLTGQIP